MGVVKRGNAYEVRVQRKAILRGLGIESGIYTFTIKDEAEAHRQHDAFCADLDRGIIPRAILRYAKGLTAKTMTVADLYKIMQADKEYQPSDSVTTLLATIWETIKDISLADFDRHALVSWIGDMKSLQNAPGTIRKKTCALRTLFDYAISHNLGDLEQNVFLLLPRDYSQYPGYKNKRANVKRDCERDRRLDDAEEKALRKAIKEFRLDPRRRVINDKFKPSLMLMLDIALNTGMRMQEIFLMEWKHIDLDKRMIGIPAPNTKGNYSRQIPISSLLLPELKKYKLQHQLSEPTFVLPFYVYYKCHRYNCSQGLSHTWDRIIAKARLADFTFHDLRHEAISRMVERTDLSETKLRQISGHKNGRTFDRYVQLRVENITGKFY